MSWSTSRTHLPSCKPRRPNSATVLGRSVKAYRPRQLVGGIETRRVEVVNRNPDDAGKAILVPLTTSLYVPGTLADTDGVIVDVGTGFFVERVPLTL